MRKTYKLGALFFSISGESDVARAIHSEFEPIVCNGDGVPHIEFVVTDNLANLRPAVEVGGLRVGSDFFQACNRGVEYQVYREGENRLKVLFCCRSRHQKYANAVTNKWRQFKNWNYLTEAETTAKDFVYDVFDYISAIILLGLDACYLHASSFADGERGVALVAWGGVGKTTSMLKLVMEDGWQFLSDDLGLIDHEGRLWRTPKRMQIYGYNVLGQPKLRKALLSDRSPLDLLSWNLRRHFKGPKRVRRRVSPERLLGAAKVGTSSQLTDVFFLERFDGADFDSVTLSIEEAAQRAAMILLYELQPFTDFSVAMHSTSVQPILPSVGDFVSQCCTLLYNAFAGSSLRLLRIPQEASPDAVASFIRKQLRRIG